MMRSSPSAYRSRTLPEYSSSTEAPSHPATSRDPRVPARRCPGQRTRSGERTIRAMADLEVQYLQVQTTTDSRAEAMELSRAAVEARLAACAQVAGPVASVYWWDGGSVLCEERRHLL